LRLRAEFRDRSKLAPCSITRISKSEITGTIHNESAFAELFISHLLARNSRIEADLVDQLFNSSKRSPDERSEIRGKPIRDDTAFRCAHAGYTLLSSHSPEPFAGEGVAGA
jgi:hypothetical protein